MVVVEDWPDSTDVPAKFPLWGDADELLRLIDVEPQADDHRFVGPAHGPTRRDVVEGGQLLAEAIVAMSKTIAGQRVTSASMIFTKAASFDAPVDVGRGDAPRPDVLHRRSRVVTGDSLRAAGILLCDSGAHDLIRDAVEMPDVAGPGRGDAVCRFRDDWTRDPRCRCGL